MTAVAEEGQLAGSSCRLHCRKWTLHDPVRDGCIDRELLIILCVRPNITCDQGSIDFKTGKLSSKFSPTLSDFPLLPNAAHPQLFSEVRSSQTLWRRHGDEPGKPLGPRNKWQVAFHAVTDDELLFYFAMSRGVNQIGGFITSRVCDFTERAITFASNWTGK